MLREKWIHNLTTAAQLRSLRLALIWRTRHQDRSTENGTDTRRLRCRVAYYGSLRNARRKTRCVRGELESKWTSGGRQWLARQNAHT
jgi:hypothetical protein